MTLREHIKQNLCREHEYYDNGERFNWNAILKFNRSTFRISEKGEFTSDLGSKTMDEYILDRVCDSILPDLALNF